MACTADRHAGRYHALTRLRRVDCVDGPSARRRMLGRRVVIDCWIVPCQKAPHALTYPGCEMNISLKPNRFAYRLKSGVEAHMKRQRTPQEKKTLSLENDRRNVVAESQWGGRDAIAKRKQWVNQSHRKAVHQELSALSGSTPADPEAVESAVASAKRHNWRKFPDVPLKVALELRRSRKPAGTAKDT